MLGSTLVHEEVKDSELNGSTYVFLILGRPNGGKPLCVAVTLLKRGWMLP
jgi:hypothetical protein